MKEFSDLVRHPGGEFVYVVSGRIVVHTELYDAVPLDAGQSIYTDSKMSRAYVTGKGCDEAVVVGVCSSAADGLMDLHGEDAKHEQAAFLRRFAARIRPLDRLKPITPEATHGRGKQRRSQLSGFDHRTVC